MKTVIIILTNSSKVIDKTRNTLVQIIGLMN